jgi:hypothetical protein
MGVVFLSPSPSGLLSVNDPKNALHSQHACGVLNQFRALSCAKRDFHGVTMMKKQCHFEPGRHGVGYWCGTNECIVPYSVREVLGAVVQLLGIFCCVQYSAVRGGRT